MPLVGYPVIVLLVALQLLLESVAEASSEPHVVATIAVGKHPIAVAANPTTNLVYVANHHVDTGSVTVIDGATNTVTATIGVSRPNAVGVDPTRNRIYVAGTFGYTGSNLMSVIDGATNTVTATIHLGGTGPSLGNGLGVDPSTNRIYAAKVGYRIAVIDGATDKGTGPVGVGYGTSGIGVDPTTNRI